MMQPNFRQILAAVAVLAVLPSLVCADFSFMPMVSKMKNVVTVAKSGGKFTDVKTAIDSITDADENNPYLVLIGPGVYTVSQPIQLKAYVTVMGNGKNATLLKGAVSSTSNYDSAIIIGMDHAVLKNLGVENTGGSQYSVGIYNNNASPLLESIAVTVFGGSTSSLGIYNFSSSPVMTHVTVTLSGGTSNKCIHNDSSSPVMTDVTATAKDGTTGNTGIANHNASSPVMTHVTAEASGGDYNTGIYNVSASNPVMTHVTAKASGGTDMNIGVHNQSSSPMIRNCTLEGAGGTTHYGIYAGTVVLSTVIGGGDSAVCNACFDANGTPLGSTCN